MMWYTAGSGVVEEGDPDRILKYFVSRDSPV